MREDTTGIAWVRSRPVRSFKALRCLVCLLLVVIAVLVTAEPGYGKGKKGAGGKGGVAKGNRGKGGVAKGKKPTGPVAKAKRGKARKGKGSAGGGGKGSPANIIRADVLAWILAHNQGLSPHFLTTEPPGKTIRLPDGRTVPIYQLKQFLDVNFRLTFFARKKVKGSDVVPVMETRLRKLMALPEFHDWIVKHRPTYRISPKGRVSAEAAYQHFRRVHRHLGVTAGKRYRAPVGGGGGIAAPSWAVWRAMNLFFHEACHCIGIGHNSGGLSGPLAAALRSWDRKKRWNYETIDLNRMAVRTRR